MSDSKEKQNEKNFIKNNKIHIKTIECENFENKIEKLEEETVMRKFQQVIKEKNKNWKEKLLEKWDDLKKTFF